MKKWLIIAPIAAAAAAGAALALKGKSGADKKPTAKAASKPAAKAGGKKDDGFVMKNPTAGVYSFASGYKDAKEVTVTITYDADKHAFGVVSEGYITDSGDSHVAIINADDFSIARILPRSKNPLRKTTRTSARSASKTQAEYASQTAAAIAWHSRWQTLRPTMSWLRSFSWATTVRMSASSSARIPRCSPSWIPLS